MLIFNSKSWRMIWDHIFYKKWTRVRALVLSFSLKIEAAVTHLLRQVLNIEEPSKSFGNKTLLFL